MKVLKRISLLFLFSFLGAIVGVILAYAIGNGSFAQWKYLGKPPEKAIEVIQPGYIKTDTGNIYRYNSEFCNSGCWEKVNVVPPPPKTEWKLSDCVKPPSLNNYISSKTACESWGVGTSLTIYAIGKDGFVYFWNHAFDESYAIMVLYSPFIGAAVGLFIGFVVLLFVLFFDWLNWLQQRAVQKGIVK